MTGYVELTLRFEREGNKWVGTCLELGTSTYARTLERVSESIKALVIEHLDLLEESGERERFFTEHNITLHRAKPQPHEVPVPNVEASSLHGGIGPLFQPSIFPMPMKLSA